MDQDRPISRRKVSLALLTSLDLETQMRIREIRNEEGVRRWMYSDHEIGANEHLGWINRLKTDKNQLVFAVLDDGQTPLGVVSVNRIVWTHKTTDWAYYLTQDSRGSGLGSALEYEFIDFVFHSLGMEKINCEVIDGNDAVVKLHKKFSFKEEGFRRSNTTKAGTRAGVHLLGLTREEWEADRAEIHKNYSRVLGKFSIDIQWRKPEAQDGPDSIDQIESARAKNNLNWMAILRLALEKSPEVAKPIVSEIRQLDREISALSDKLIT